jgi:hypothetical protein
MPMEALFLGTILIPCIIATAAQNNNTAIHIQHKLVKHAIV